ncbi:MAG: hypothetical protein L6R37_001307 [Teloschistes peruensis]|nr:MAG: hypothetical protein L6R37_001307 [Teloschistes peruensis]
MASKESQPSPQSQPVNLASLPINQLTSIKIQLAQELQHLTNSFSQLRAAQAKFRDCIKSIQQGIEKSGRKEGTSPRSLPPCTANCIVCWESRGEKLKVAEADEGRNIPDAAGTPILVPLTPSLYVPGKLASTATVLVDIGTGFYVEKLRVEDYSWKQTPLAARQFYTSKVGELGKSLKDLESIVQGKQGNLTVVDDVLRQKVLSESASPNNEEAKGGGGPG